MEGGGQDERGKGEVAGRGAIWPVKTGARTETERRAEAVRADEERRRYWNERWEVSREDLDTRWRSEERDADLDRMERVKGGRVSMVRRGFAPAKGDWYAKGAAGEGEAALRAAWDLKWGPGNAAELLRRATTMDMVLQM